MFIETVTRANRRSSGAQCSGKGTRVGLPFRSSGARTYVEGLGSINISSLLDEELAKTILLRNEVVGLLRSRHRFQNRTGFTQKSLDIWTSQLMLGALTPSSATACTAR